MCLVRISDGTRAILTEEFHSFSQSLQVNVGIALRFGHDCFLPNSFPTYQSSFHPTIQDTVTCRPIAREPLGKQARNKYATNNKVDPFLGNARNNRTAVARHLFYVGSHISIARQRMFSVLWSDPRLYNKTTIIAVSVGGQNSSRGVTSRKKMTV
jgi:hypothetical protein